LTKVGFKTQREFGTTNPNVANRLGDKDTEGIMFYAGNGEKEQAEREQLALMETDGCKKGH
jgi:23S rRNA-/tRNA-specific pseudouridylate synthase